MNNTKLIARLVDNFYEVERMIENIEKEARNYNTSYTLYSNEVHTLKVIAEHEGLSQTELTAMMMRTKGATSVVLDKLVKKGLIIKKPGEDQRFSQLYLTEKGWKVHNAHLKYDTEYIQPWFNQLDLTGEELEKTSEVLEKIIDYYKNEIYKKKIVRKDG